ncbi:sugar transferase [Limosilactobacillus sp. Sa3CUN2]|uniref:Sugar transferase n=1 Tax=Limosilactobacillus avistercoris TaxID=2762243 RepID=A0ABR8PDN3_9LACO|nr:sugar transferase [Limosilactobacillus avistercoris]MBD7895288.1 sugar transferase [Limosilactobacillus avistercoris]
MIEQQKLIDQKQVESRKVYHLTKRFLDIVLSTLGLIGLSPVMGIVAYKIKREDGGPVFYKQVRVGKNGKKFKMYKFRSMVVNADQLLDKLKEKNDVDGAMFKMKHDPRITKVGHFIREHSLDELPQLVNVLKGDMSLVGPRPPLPSEVEQYTSYDKQRLYVVPGCTGLWQATERNNVGFDEMVGLDLKYIKNCSVKYDLLIIWKTIAVIFTPNSSY